MISEETKELIEKYLTGTATEDEIIRLRAWYRTVNDADIKLDFDVKSAQSVIKEKLFTKLNLPLEKVADESTQPVGQESRPNLISFWNASGSGKHQFIAAAAVLLLFIILAGLYWQRSDIKKPAIASNSIEIPPGHHGAVLYLSTGKSFMLDTVKEGLIAIDGNLKIIRQGDAVRYEGSNPDTHSLFNRIKTDYGRTWHVILPDGSKVWLNALSSIKFPLNFSIDTRTVSLNGEGYFEVVHNANRPFKVQVGDYVMEDIGTAFNVNAYEDEPTLKTTLMEGSVKVVDKDNSVVLKPGQQAVIKDSIEVLDKINTASEMAWKNGYFQFQSASLQEVMRQISRWYHVDVEYKGDIAPELFMGKIPKNMPASKVLNILEQAGVSFDIVAAPEDQTGGKIVVSPS